MKQVFVLSDEFQTRRLWAFLKNNAKACAEAKKPLQVTVGEYKRNRSVEQNKMLHRLLTHIVENAWVAGRQYDLETWKEHFRRTFIGCEEYTLPSGEIQQRGISTTTLDVKEFTEFLDRIQDYMINTLGLDYVQE